MVDLSKCNGGELLLSSQGAILEYVQPTPMGHLTYLDHVVRYVKDENGKEYPPDNFGTRTNDGRVYPKNPKPDFDHDIIKILK